MNLRFRGWLRGNLTVRVTDIWGKSPRTDRNRDRRSEGRTWSWWRIIRARNVDLVVVGECNRLRICNVIVGVGGGRRSGIFTGQCH